MKVGKAFRNSINLFLSMAVVLGLQLTASQAASKIETEKGKLFSPTIERMPLTLEADPSNVKIKEGWESELDSLLTPFAQTPTNLVIHNFKYPLKNKFQMGLELSSLVSDKYLNTFGTIVSASYYFTHRWGVAGSFGYFKSSLTKDADLVRSLGGNPLIYDPQMSIGASVRFVPTYGKFTIGNSIRHFRIFADLGISALQTKSHISANSANFAGDKMAIAPTIGSGFWVHLNQNINLQARINYAIYNQIGTNSTSFRSVWMFSSGLNYVF